MWINILMAIYSAQMNNLLKKKKKKVIQEAWALLEQLRKACVLVPGDDI